MPEGEIEEGGSLTCLGKVQKVIQKRESFLVRLSMNISPLRPLLTHETFW